MVNQLGINLGVYMLLPYLANHLSSGLDLAAWTVGLVIGVRTLSEQGLFLVGGMLADRFGYRRMIATGCALRGAGFALLGIVADLPMLLVASVAVGLAGALFGPAVRAYIAAEAGDRRVAAFALFNVFYQTGVLAGPLLGLVLLSVDFRAVCLTAASIFLALSVAQLRLLPPGPSSPATGRQPGLTGVRADWREVTRNRSFLLFSLTMVGSHVLSSQIYLALPLQATQVLAARGDLGSGALFGLSAVVAILGQVWITGWVWRWGNPARAVTLGLALMAVAFLPLAVTAGLTARGGSPGVTALAMVPTLTATVLLTLGSVVAYPFEMDIILGLTRNRLVATYYGMHNTFAGIGVTVGNLVTGVVWGLGQELGFPALPWLVLAGTGAACTGAVIALARPGRLDAPPAARPVPSDRPPPGGRTATAVPVSPDTAPVPHPR
ncbi:MFS transporter [Micromonospora echinofusca]|uniref:MFS transporter n=2 Tax=Micromonospora echinofusca TaxID=47858 RepID=A0ABS3VNT5_MICEH|nr:MFS transporter [Micromonospora echinofusca]